MPERFGALFFVEIVHHETGMDDSGNPAKHRQQQTQDETPHPSGEQHRDGRENDAKEIAERLHFVDAPAGVSANSKR